MRYRVLTALGLAALLCVAVILVPACGDDDPKERCEECNSTSDCVPGLSCLQFRVSGETRLLCANPDVLFQVCNVRE